MSVEIRDPRFLGVVGETADLELLGNGCAFTEGPVWHPHARLVTCEHPTSRVVRTEYDGTLTVQATHCRRKEFNSPNDVVARSGGLIYFTDPTFGRLEHYGMPRAKDMNCQGIYAITLHGETIIPIADDFGQPNGLCFSHDERHTCQRRSPPCRHLRPARCRPCGG